MMQPFQANTGVVGGSPMATDTGNWFLDGLNNTIGTIAAGAQVYGDILDTKTQNEITLLNAKAQVNPQGTGTSAQPQNVVVSTDTKTLERVMFVVGATMIVFAATVMWTGRK